MQINAITAHNPRINFKGDSQQYENPVNRATERNLAILSATGVSTFAGLVAGGITTCCTKGYKLPLGVGIVAALATLGLTLPSKLYNTKIGAFTREKEMDVFTRQKEAQTNIYDGINKEIKDNDVPLDQKVNHYATTKIADNGSGVMVKGA